MNTAYALILACLLAILGALPADAREWRPWCGPAQEREAAQTLGWHFYCDQKEEADEDAQTPSSVRPSPPVSPMKRILKMRRALDETRARAILDPSPENVRAYLALQQEALGRAALFSDASRRVVWASPGLDYTLKRPVGALAKQLWSIERRAERDGVLARLGTRYGLDLSRPPGMSGLPGVRAPPARLRAASRDKGARGLDDGRAYRGLARGGGG